MVNGSTTQWAGFNAFLLIFLFFATGILYYKGLITVFETEIILGIILIFALITIYCKIGDKLTPNGWASISAILLIIFMVISGFFAPKGVNYFLVFIIMLVFFAVLGSLVSGRIAGILIDERNQMSLSRFQIVVWTGIILSAYLAMALVRIAANVPNPLEIGMEWQIWALLGISTVSLVGSPLLLSEKKKKKSDPTEKINLKTEVAKGDIKIVGLIPVNTSPDAAEFADIFRGDETATLKNINMAKVQMFFFTIIIALSYGLMIYLMIATNTDPATMDSFPALDDSLVALLAISHAGYLTNKSIDQTAKE
ncbi:hypothetical protein [Methanobacterium alcaliphilum]|uniref:hypothetical protein n=1 Tax=Methanobacterium alcaliphilum TaxID=392018 RepID=UPI00200B7FAD|nr:hypothetical protein [Methanobacterium alcaliphilum]MCK9151668.1 hypothetical protein [Methanobacterium alcaliphilum]